MPIKKGNGVFKNFIRKTAFIIMVKLDAAAPSGIPFLAVSRYFLNLKKHLQCQGEPSRYSPIL